MRSPALLATYDTPEHLLGAVAALRAHGYALETYTPHPVRGLHAALAAGPSRIPRWGLAGAVAGLAGGYGLQAWASIFSYPLRVAGRPLHSWPAFIPVTFEMTVLGAALALFVGVFWENRLPAYHHPLFAHPEFSRAMLDRYLLLVTPAGADAEADRARVAATGAVALSEVDLAGYPA